MTGKLQLAGFLLIVASGLSACTASQNTVGAPCAAALAASGSAAPQSPDAQLYSAERADPLEPFNQAMFTFNRKADDWVLHPDAAGWAHVMPQAARAGVGRFFQN